MDHCVYVCVCVSVCVHADFKLSFQSSNGYWLLKDFIYQRENMNWGKGQKDK